MRAEELVGRGNRHGGLDITQAKSANASDQSAVRLIAQRAGFGETTQI